MTDTRTAQQFSAVDRYITSQLVPNDAVLEQTLQANAAAKLPAIDVAPNQGKLLQLIAQMIGARRILEIGTLGGYSTIWMARALPEDGRLVTLEFDPTHAETAKSNIARAGLESVVEVRVGPALETLPKLADEQPFDLIFIDADKKNNAHYLDWAIKLSRSGSVIVCDNVVREGAILDAESNDSAVKGNRDLFAKLACEPRLNATAIQTVGSKGWDGFAIAVVR